MEKIKKKDLIKFNLTLTHQEEKKHETEGFFFKEMVGMEYSKTEESRSLKNENDTGQLIFFIKQLYVIVGSVETLTNDSAGNTILSVR